MKFVKGMLIGGAAAMGAVMMYSEMSNKNKKRMLRMGRNFVKKMGIL